MVNLRFNRQRKKSVTLPVLKGVDDSVDGLVSSLPYSKISYNLDWSSGALKEGAGVGEFFPQCSVGQNKALALYFYKRLDPVLGRDDKIMAYMDDGFIYSCPLSGGTFTKIEELEFDQKPIGVCYNYNSEDVIIFSGGTSGMKIYDGNSVEEVASAPSVTSMCIHFERLFVTGGEGGALWFSDDFDPANWNVSLGEAGFIGMSDFRGDMLKCLSFGDYVYVFRSYGISRVTAYGDQSDFMATNLFLSSGKILGNSVTTCGNIIIFCASDGFYAFNGSSASRILQNYDGVLDYDYSGVKGKYYNGKAYFIVKEKNNGSVGVNGSGGVDGTGNGLDGNIVASDNLGELGDINCLLCYDLKSGVSYLIKGANFIDIQLIDGEGQYKLAVICDDGKLYELTHGGNICGSSPQMMWQSKFGDFGVTAPNKLLYSCQITTLSDAEITFTSDRQTITFALKGQDKIQVLRPRISGDLFEVTIKTSSPSARIAKLKVTFYYYEVD